MGHSILVIPWHLLTNDCDYADLGGDYFARRDTDRQRQRAVAQLQALGYRVSLWAWPALTDIPDQECDSWEDVHHGDHGTQATSRAPVVHP